MSEIIRILPKLNLHFDEARWNSPVTRNKSNCLSYAFDEPTTGFASYADIIGLEHIAKMPSWMASPEEVKKVLDEIEKHPALIRVLKHQVDTDKHHLFALDVHGSHAFRFNSAVKLWGEKRANYSARMWDDNGNVITDLETANLVTKRPEDIAYFVIAKEGFEIQPNSWQPDAMHDPVCYQKAKKQFEARQPL